MKAVRLIARSDEYNSSLGLAIKAIPDFDGFMVDRDGSSIAHDILEHQNGAKNMGPIWDELEACGGVWQVRGRHGDMLQSTGQMYSPAQNVAADIERMFWEWDGYNGPHSMRTKRHLYDDDFNEIIDEARSSIMKEAAYRTDSDDEQLDPVKLESYLRLAFHSLRTGFRKAERRFGDRFCGHSTFAAIQQEIKRACFEVEYEGQEFILCYGDCTATIREVYAPEDY